MPIADLPYVPEDDLNLLARFRSDKYFD